ncbi:hypothetical protein Pfo_013666 [Paulownia fortunei]|nr:hypothetical protein Pfo_013666 [Paulownia fortunei]
MATTANLNGIFEALPVTPKLRVVDKIRKRARVTCFLDKKKDEVQDSPVQATRRLAIGLASIALFGNASIGNSVAEDNGFWLTGPLPVPYANNSMLQVEVDYIQYFLHFRCFCYSKKVNFVYMLFFSDVEINNEETGTRSFIKKGIYIANIGTKGRMHRLKKYAFDLIAMGDLIAQQDAWNYVRRYLRLKSTFMYFDFDEVISAAPVDDKKSLTDLANRLFDSVEKLEDAVKKQNLPQTESCYQATTTVLEEVMNRMA